MPNPRITFHSDDWQAIPFAIMFGGFSGRIAESLHIHGAVGYALCCDWPILDLGASSIGKKCSLNAAASEIEIGRLAKRHLDSVVERRARRKHR
jgi:hypothetical protein